MEKNWVALDAIFNPRSVAVIGASDNPGKLGSHVMRSLVEGRYPGSIYPVNPGKEEILGIKTYPSLSRFLMPLICPLLSFRLSRSPK